MGSASRWTHPARRPGCRQRHWRPGVCTRGQQPAHHLAQSGHAPHAGRAGRHHLGRRLQRTDHRPQPQLPPHAGHQYRARALDPHLWQRFRSARGHGRARRPAGRPVSGLRKKPGQHRLAGRHPPPGRLLVCRRPDRAGAQHSGQLLQLPHRRWIRQQKRIELGRRCGLWGRAAAGRRPACPPDGSGQQHLQHHAGHGNGGSPGPVPGGGSKAGALSP
ncbi:hypothetical protein D3C72_1395670 [compost metagenome]